MLFADQRYIQYVLNKYTWLNDAVYISPETDPIFEAWLAAWPILPPGSETDPVFTAWLATPPNVSIFTNDAWYITSWGPETDPVFSAWLLATPPLYSFTETDPVFSAWLLLNPPQDLYEVELNLPRKLGSNLYKTYTYTWADLTAITYYSNNGMWTILFNKVLTWVAGVLTTTVLTDHVNGHVLTKTFAYDINWNILNVYSVIT